MKEGLGERYEGRRGREDKVGYIRKMGDKEGEEERIKKGIGEKGLNKDGEKG